LLKRGASKPAAQPAEAVKEPVEDVQAADEPKRLSQAIEDERREAAAEKERELATAVAAGAPSEADGHESSPADGTRRENV
jgi:hypothetical protein